MLALQGHKQSLTTQKEEEKILLKHAQFFFGQQGRDQNGRVGKRNFNSKGRGFTPIKHYNGNHNPQSNVNIPKWSNNNTIQPKKRHQQQRPTSSNNNSKVTCQICGKPNHLAIDCWYRLDYSYQSKDFPQVIATLAMNDSND